MNSNEVVPCGKMKFFNIWKFSNCWLLTWKLMDELDQISPGSAFFSFRLRVHYGQNFTNFVKATDLKLMDELDQISPGSAGTLWTKFYKFCQGY
ncbi:uncharacterized protein LOC119608412 isoform X3 [Lucilia sericata]|uniref:uncharacterized protein LOC119608412 isoform X3 n=1 Tax=Lucilia sericata TaxID=13632 RepID=UPI0018A825FB|nr:uncharacterized protein LOC119608412 isoform X3 [Lucilia sericata]XP_037818756.1 uncharacterized protein LOC119608412 isoform X3 [Lucilia sericata]